MHLLSLLTLVVTLLAVVGAAPSSPHLLARSASKARLNTDGFLCNTNFRLGESYASCGGNELVYDSVGTKLVPSGTPGAKPSRIPGYKTPQCDHKIELAQIFDFVEEAAKASGSDIQSFCDNFNIDKAPIEDLRLAVNIPDNLARVPEPVNQIKKAYVGGGRSKAPRFTSNDYLATSDYMSKVNSDLSRNRILPEITRGLRTLDPNIFTQQRLRDWSDRMKGTAKEVESKAAKRADELRCLPRTSRRSPVSYFAESFLGQRRATCSEAYQGNSEPNSESMPVPLSTATSQTGSSTSGLADDHSLDAAPGTLTSAEPSPTETSSNPGGGLKGMSQGSEYPTEASRDPYGSYSQTLALSSMEPWTLQSSAVVSDTSLPSSASSQSDPTATLSPPFPTSDSASNTALPLSPSLSSSTLLSSSSYPASSSPSFTSSSVVSLTFSPSLTPPSMASLTSSSEATLTAAPPLATTSGLQTADSPSLSSQDADSTGTDSTRSQGLGQASSSSLDPTFSSSPSSTIARTTPQLASSSVLQASPSRSVASTFGRTTPTPQGQTPRTKAKTVPPTQPQTKKLTPLSLGAARKQSKLGSSPKRP